MNIHKNARLTPLGRERLVRLMQSGHTPQSASQLAGVCPRTARKWLRRYMEEGVQGLQDRSSRPKKLYRPTDTATVQQIVALRRQRLTGKHIARETGVSPATVSRVLKRVGLSRLKDLEPAEAVRRYERAAPGDMIHLDIKKLGRFDRIGHRITKDRRRQSNQRSNGTAPGWEYVHVAIDDHSRVSFSRIFTDEKADSAVSHLKAAVAYYRTLGVKVVRVMTDNGACYRSKAFAKACRDLKIKHVRTKPYTPQTNGKAERFIQTALREWAYARAYQTSDQRAAELQKWTHMYNWHRPHGGIKDKTPISRLKKDPDNLLRLHI